MAKNISWLGASYSDVSYITLPKTGGGSARFDDASVTTAVASDVASGKTFIASDGTVTTGTNSGGGGASNIVMGTFTADSGTGAAHTVSLPYTGNGYPIAAMVFIAGGAYESGSDWYTSYQKYTIAQWTFSKAVQSSTPTYGTSGAQNQGVTTWIYKNSSATNYSRSSAMTTNVLTSSNATGAGATCCRLKGKATLSYYTASTSYGLLAGQEYKYTIVYSE